MSNLSSGPIYIPHVTTAKATLWLEKPRGYLLLNATSLLRKQLHRLASEDPPLLTSQKLEEKPYNLGQPPTLSERRLTHPPSPPAFPLLPLLQINLQPLYTFFF